MDPTKTIKPHGQSTNCIVVSPGGLVLAGADHGKDERIYLYDAGLEQRAAMWAEQMHDVTCAAFNDDETRALTGHGSWGGVKLWNLETGQLERSLLGGCYVRAVAFQKGKALVCHGGSKLMKIPLDADEQSDIDKTHGHDAAFGPDPTWWVNVADTSSNVPVLRKGSKKLRNLDGHDVQISVLAFSATHVATGDCGGRLLLHELQGGTRTLWDSNDFDTSPTGLAFSTDGARLAVGLEDGSARVLEVASGAEIATVVPDGVIGIEGIALSPDGRRLYCGNYQGELLLYELP